MSSQCSSRGYWCRKGNCCNYLVLLSAHNQQLLREEGGQQRYAQEQAATANSRSRMLATENWLQGNHQRAASRISWRNSTAAWRYTKQEQLLSCLQQHKGEQVQLHGMQMATGCNGNTKTAMRESRERTRQHGYWQKGKTHWGLWGNSITTVLALG